MLFLALLTAVRGLDVGKDTFKIVQFTDMHYGEDKLSDRLTQELQDWVIQEEDPDLIVLTGDMVSGYAWPGTAHWYAQQHAQYTAPMQKRHKHWALTLGNHDAEGDLTAHEIIVLDQRQVLSLTGLSTALNHTSNYYITVHQQGELKLLIYMLDTGNREHGQAGYDKVHQDQVD